MYKIGTLLLYDRRGVCRVESVGPAPIREARGSYYKLRALFSGSGEVIYTPVEGPAPMRPLIGGAEAEAYLEDFSRLEPDTAPGGKPADLSAHCRGLLASRQVEDCLLLIKELYLRQQELSRRKKRPGQADVLYLKLAEKLICEEFAVALDTTPERVLERLREGGRREATA